jgi:hypothetical protein
MSPNRRDREKKVAGVANKNSPCTTSVLNLGNTLRVPGAHTVDMETDAKVVLPDRDEKQTLPTKVRMMSMLSMAHRYFDECRSGWVRKTCARCCHSELHTLHSEQCEWKAS